MSCIMFGVSSNAIKEGDQILATGSMRYYSKGGRLNFYVTSAVPYGSGILYQKFLELKNKLELEGLFDNKNKKPLPEKINTIGVITSKTGAVLHDIQTVSHRRNPCLNIIVYPAKVQGVGAELTIVDGLKYFDKQKDIDVIIIARGGGSIEDLQPFNTEILAREIVKVSKPVISAVGHETDFTICDFASSIRVATPSVGAELVAINVYEKLEKINVSLDKLTYLAFHLYDNKQEKLELLTTKLSNLITQSQRENENKFYQNLEKLKNLFKVLFLSREHNLELSNNKLLLLNPTETLNRGWVRLSKNSKVISSIKNVKENDDVLIEMKDGSISAVVKSFKEKN